MYLSQFFEVVLVFPSLDSSGDPLPRSIDRRNISRGEITRANLDRDHGTPFLDLQRIPRDPQHVIVMAKDPAFCKQVEPRGSVHCSGRTCWW